MLVSRHMRSKSFGFSIGFIAIIAVISLLYVGLVFAQTSTSTSTGNTSTEVTTPDSISEAANATTSPAGGIDSDQALPAEQEISEDKTDFLDRSAVEKEFAREFAEF